MNAPHDSGDDDRFTRLLTSVEQQLAGDGSTEDPAETAGDAGGEVEKRLKKARRCLELIDRVRRADPDALAAEPPREAAPRSAELADSPSEPLTIGRFQIIRELGRGGHGVVYLALDPELDREVALKVPRPEVVVSGGMDRFMREAKAVAGLSHANIVPIYEAGHVGPIWYITSAYCRGVSLAEWLRQRSDPVAARQAAELVVHLAEATQHAHGRGVVHRDLKPSNVLLELPASAGDADTGATPKPLITDFGLAKLVNADSEATRTGAVLGTPAYMAPEQATASPDVGPAVDLYALGAILYELLTGRPPFSGDSIGAILRAVEFDEPVAPSRLRRDVPRDLEAICLKCLEKAATRRYMSGTSLAADLTRYLRGEPVLARKISSAERLARWSRRNPLTAGLGATVALALVAGSGISTYFAMAERRALNDTRAALQAKTAALEETREKIDHYVASVQTEELLKDARFQPLRKKLLADALDYYQKFIREHQHDPAAREALAKSLLNFAEITYDNGSRNEALVAFRQAAQLYATLLEANPADFESQQHLARSHYWIGAILYEQGEAADAEAMHQQAIDIQQRLVARHPDNATFRNELSQTRNELGKLYRDTNRPDLALAEFHECVRILRDVVNQHPRQPAYRRELAVSYGTIGILHHNRGQFADALAAHQQSIELFTALTQEVPEVDSYQGDLASGRNNMAAAYIRLGKRPEALEVFEHNVAAYQRLAAAHPTVAEYQHSLASGYMNLASLYAQSNRMHEAADSFGMARPLIERILREDPDNVDHNLLFATVHLNYASALSDTDAPAEALGQIDIAIKTLDNLLLRIPEQSRARFFIGLAHAVRGRVLAELGRHAESLVSWRRACEFEGPRSGRHARVGLGQSLARNGQHAEAVEQANRLAGLAGGQSSVLYDTATIFALAAGAVDQDGALTQAHRETQFESYMTQAIDLLRKAHAAGHFKDAQSLEKAKADPDLAPLIERETFRRFLDSLADP